MTDNPLLQLTSLPDFGTIHPDHIVPAIRQLLAETDAERQQLEAGLEPTWAGLMQPLEQLDNRLSLAWGAVGHLMGVKNSEALRQAHQEMQGEVVQFWMQLGQSQAIYQGLKTLKASAAWSQLDAAQQRIVDSSIQDAELSGVGLEGEPRARFNAIQQELAELSTTFSNHLLDATKAFYLDLQQPQEIEGLPPSLLQMAAQAARDAGHDQATPEQGPWRITLDFPSVGPFLEHSRRRDLREQVYRALITRASEGELDNTPLISRILELRREQASILGYANYAELSLASKMAPDVQTVEALLEQLRQASFDAAQQDLADLRDFARSQGAAEADELQHWDIAFWAERLREHRYAISDEELRPYFPLPNVLEGLFALVQRLFGVTIRPADDAVSVWHPEVRFFRIYNADQEEIAAFYLDAYSRPAEKRGGAWMNECVGRSRLLAAPGTSMRLPVAYLICNQTPPVNGKPSLMSFTEVTTLFHEFGHGLHHMLTQVDYGMAAGIRNVEWDAVELPSQFMENWCYHRETLMGMSGHVDTGEPLPEELFQKLLAARNYRSGSAMLRQLYFGFMDMELHARYDPAGDETVFDVQRRIAAKTTPLMPLPEDRFLCSFGHIFAGGYAAGYYSYKWAEVLSADAFAAFEESGLDDEQALVATGRRYRDTVLALGGSRHPMEVFKAFRGREPSTEALLRHSGLAA
ncbi:M3 family metallopeptidase [Candidatus Entotheonella palauensis]|uniref:M3 family metallopeptidase n=1 Tax=Candidatus Entotheonella palauensis TaxID=93172 RepID=UPI000B7F3840|nr:M3 family metallopeptidase [Candidatus Entotheonella palauensis]